MYSAEKRLRLRVELLEEAASDGRLSGAAVTGSAAEGREDQWSDIDLAFGLAGGADLEAVLADWTARMYERCGALHHFDMKAGAWTYRVFLLEGALQVDLAFVPEAEFRPLAPSFRLVFGKAGEARDSGTLAADGVVGMGWLYAIHARSAIGRGRWWQAEYMISGVRDSAMALACLRHGVAAVHGRGFHLLPPEEMASFEAALVRSTEPEELKRAFRAAVNGLVREIRDADPRMAERLEPVLVGIRDEPDWAVG